MSTNETPATESAPVRLEVGDLAPAFSIETTRGTVTLSGLVEGAAKGVVVYFYPKAGTPGCTKEACDFRDNLNSLKGAGYSVIGISADSTSALEKFQDSQQLNFLLGSDPSHQIMTTWGGLGREEELREDLPGNHSLDLRGGQGRTDLPRSVQREGDWTRRAPPAGIGPGLTVT